MEGTKGQFMTVGEALERGWRYQFAKDGTWATTQQAMMVANIYCYAEPVPPERTPLAEGQLRYVAMKRPHSVLSRPSDHYIAMICIGLIGTKRAAVARRRFEDCEPFGDTMSIQYLETLAKTPRECMRAKGWNPDGLECSTLVVI